MQNARWTAISLTFLFLFAAMIPMVSALNEPHDLATGLIEKIIYVSS